MELAAIVVPVVTSVILALLLHRGDKAVTVEVIQIGQARNQQINDLLGQATEDARARAQEAEETVVRLRAELLRRMKKQKCLVRLVFGLLLFVFLSAFLFTSALQ